MGSKGKIALAVTGLLSAVILLFLIFIAPRGKDISKLEMSDAEINDIISERSEANGPMAKSITFNGNALVYDRKGDAYYYSLVEGSSGARNPDVKIESEQGDVEIAFSYGGIEDRAMREATPIEAVLYDDTSYRRIKIYCTTLPLISIEYSDEAIEDEYVPMAMRVFDNRREATQRLTVCEGKIHVRGQSSKGYPKKSYRLTLLDKSLGRNTRELNISLLGLRKDADLVLYAAYNDQERVRNVFSANLWYDTCAANNSFGIINGVEYRFCELFLNGEYFGLYALGFPIDAEVVGIAPGEYTYQKFTRDDELSLDYLDLNRIKEHFEVKEGDVEAPDEAIWSPLVDYYTKLKSADGTERGVLGICDAPNAIDSFLFLNLVQGVDNVGDRSMQGVDITMKKLKGEYVALYTPWDLDQTWGNMWSTKSPNWIEPYSVGPDRNTMMKLNPVYLLMRAGDDKTTDAVKERYRELRVGAWSNEAISALLDKYEAQVFGSGAYLRDIERWPMSSQLSDPSAGLTSLKEHVMSRLDYVDDFIESITPAGLSDE